MKKISLKRMEDVNGGGQGRTCMILGALVMGAAIGMFWPAAFTITAGSAIYGCFN